MRNLAFVLWMVLFPMVASIGNHLLFLQGNTYSEAVEVISAIIVLAFWLFIGTLLYEKKVED